MNLYILNTNEEVVEILSGKADNSACHFFNAIMTKEINKGTTLTFEVDVAELGGSENIKEENMVVVPDGDAFKLFIIREVVDVHDTDFIKEVYCEDASIELADEVCVEEILGKHEISTALRVLLKNTRWEAGEVDDVYIRNLTGEYKGSSVLAGINTLIGEYDVEVDYSVSFAGNKITGRYVHIKEAFGRTLGKRFEYKKDIVSLKRTVNTGDIKTAIIPFGKVDEETGEAVTIESVSWSQPKNALNKPLGQTFLEDEEATQLWGYKGSNGKRRARWIVINFEECESAEELISLAYLQLKRFTSPTVSYEVEAQDLYLLTGDEDYSFETVELGDLVNIIDHDFVPALTLSSRIVKIEKNLNFPAESKITMGTIVKSIVDKDLQTQLNELNYKVSTVASNVDLTDVENRIDNLETNISSGKWETISEINNLLFGEAVGYHYIEEENGIWVYDRPKDQNPTKAVAIKGGTVGLASYDKQLQKWVVGTFIDGNSVNASMINTGTLSAERIEADSITTKHFSLDVRSKLSEIDGKATTGYVNTKLEALADEISLEISSTYETKEDVETKINTAVNNIKVGGRNLAKNTQTLTGMIGVTNTSGDWCNNTKEGDFNKLTINTTNASWVECYMPIYPAYNSLVNDVTISFDYKSSDDVLYFSVGAFNSSGARLTEIANISVQSDFKKIALANGWYRAYYTVNLTAINGDSVATDYRLQFKKASGKIGSVEVKRILFEESNKPADWTPAIEDIQGQIEAKANASEVYTKTQTDTAIKVAKDNINLSVAKVEQIATSSIQGKMLYTDLTFKSGSNSMGTYNNTGNGNVTLSRVAKSSDCPTTSGYMMQVKTSGTASPGHGGFFFANSTRANAIFVTKIIAKIPSGYTLSWASNGYGTGGKQEWLTDNVGTGKWTEYICKVSCGSSGTFSSTNYFYLSGGTAPVTWYIAMATVFDITESSNLESRMNSAEQKITDSAIISTVSSQFYKKGETDTKFATQSQLTQTVNDFTFKFNNIRNPNLIPNGSPTGSNYSGWYSEGVNAWLWTNNPDGPIAIASNNTAGEVYAWSPTIKINEGGRYSLSFELIKEWGVETTEVFLLGGSNESNLYEYINNVTGTIGDTNWRRVTVTVDIPSNIKYLKFRIDNNKCLNTGGNYTVIFDKFMFIKGDGIYPPIWYPAENEINNSTTTINNEGIIVEKGALTIKNKSGNKVFYGDANGNLTLAGNITSGATITGGTLKSTNGDMYFNMNNGYMLLYNNGVKVGQTNKNNISGTSIYGVSNGAEYGNYSSLSAKTSYGASTYSMMATVSGVDLTDYIKKGFNLGHTLHTNNWHFRMGTSTELQWRQSGSNHDSFITEGSEGMIRIYGDNGAYLGYRVGDSNMYVIAIRESGSHTYPKALSVFNEDNPATDNNGYAVEINAPIRMRGQSIEECSNIKTLGVEIVEPMPFYSTDAEEQSTTYAVTKNSQNIIEYIGSTEIINGESTIILPKNIVFKNYVVILSPIGLNRAVSLVEKSDDSFKIMGDDGTVDYVIKFESVDYSKYIAKSISVDNVDFVQRSEADLPKAIELCEDSSPDEDVPTTLEII